MKDSPQILKYVTNGAIIPFYSNGTLIMNISGSFSFFFFKIQKGFSVIPKIAIGTLCKPFYYIIISFSTSS